MSCKKMDLIWDKRCHATYLLYSLIANRKADPIVDLTYTILFILLKWQINVISKLESIYPLSSWIEFFHFLNLGKKLRRLLLPKKITIGQKQKYQDMITREWISQTCLEFWIIGSILHIQQFLVTCGKLKNCNSCKHFCTLPKNPNLMTSIIELQITEESDIRF